MNDHRTIYDAVWSLGQWCATAISLKELGLRSCSGPFDWTGPHEEFSHYVDLMINGFDGFLAKENLRKLKDDPVEGTEIYVDCVQRWETHHEFRIGVPFEENYAKYRALLDRRIKRLISSLRSNGNILFVHWLGEGKYNREDIINDIKRLRQAYPNATIDLLVIETERFTKTISFEKPHEGVIFAVGDFYDQSRFDPVMGNKKALFSVLRHIRLRGRWKNLIHLKTASLKRRLKRLGRKIK
jgi:hypothetical protein